MVIDHSNIPIYDNLPQKDSGINHFLLAGVPILMSRRNEKKDKKFYTEFKNRIEQF